jgi:hypothetical protein
MFWQNGDDRMASKWSVVNASHVEEACRLFDQKKATPVRQPTKTFLLLNGRRYPAKFIRGLAYRVATGSDPGDYSGGLETVAFLKSLGLNTDHDGQVQPEERATQPPQRLFTSKCPQKNALMLLLQARFGDVKVESKFDWLVVPGPEERSGVIRTIHDALVAHRGQSAFASAGRELCCDFHIPSHRLIIEYDERQHFTLPRGTALGLYPHDLHFGFDLEEWIDACHQTRANDPTPPYRDEQRAFYDTLRDLLAAQHEYTLIRLRDGVIDWTSSDAHQGLDDLLLNYIDALPLPETDMDREKDRSIVQSYLRRTNGNWHWEEMVRDLLGHHDSRITNSVGRAVRMGWKGKWKIHQFTPDDIDHLASFIRSSAAELGPPSNDPPMIIPEPSRSAEVLQRLHSENDISKIALVSHNYNRVNAEGLWDYSAEMKQINRRCDEERCDTILYGLFTWDVRSSHASTHDAMFSGLTHVRRIIVERGDFSAHSDDPSYKDLWVEVWLRGEEQPFIMRQRFASSQESTGKSKFMRELPTRRLGHTLLMICGESQIVSEKRAGGFADDYGFESELDVLGVNVVLNPIHHYMPPSHGIDIRKKRQLYSQGGRTVVSVWNEGGARDVDVPWTVYHDGEDRTAEVAEIDSSVADRRDIRIGVLSVDELQTGR